MSSDAGAGSKTRSPSSTGVAPYEGGSAVGVQTDLPSADLALPDDAGDGQVPRSRSRRSGRRRWRWNEVLLAYLMLLPALVIFGVFIFYPFLKNFDLALYQNPPFPGLPARYVGLHQVSQVLTSSNFLQSLETTLLFALMTVPLGLFLGLLLATAAHKRLRGMAIYRTIFSSTIASSAAVTAVIFGTLMNPAVGLLSWLGINPNPPLLTNPTWALPSIAVLTIWQGLGLSFILMSAGLQNVPDELLEAAEMDGAGPARRFWRITVPLLSPFLFFGLVISTILVFQSVGQFDILTGQQSALVHTNVLIYNIYQTLFYQRNPGQAAVLSIALFVLTMGFTLAQIRLLERRVHYG
jgi:sn-glycerol 3-phosphate transport system permease protein